jgi:hypothetical protein
MDTTETYIEHMVLNAVVITSSVMLNDNKQEIRTNISLPPSGTSAKAGEAKVYTSTLKVEPMCCSQPLVYFRRITRRL